MGWVFHNPCNLLINRFLYKSLLFKASQYIYLPYLIKRYFYRRNNYTDRNRQLFWWARILFNLFLQEIQWILYSCILRLFKSRGEPNSYPSIELYYSQIK